MTKTPKPAEFVAVTATPPIGIIRGLPTVVFDWSIYTLFKPFNNEIICELTSISAN